MPEWLGYVLLDGLPRWLGQVWKCVLVFVKLGQTDEGLRKYADSVQSSHTCNMHRGTCNLQLAACSMQRATHWAL